MLCEECNEREAEIQITEVDAKGELKEKHICKQCAVKKGYEITKQKPLEELFADFLKEADKDEESIRCSACGMSWAEFRRKGRFGCEHCYEEFGEKIEQLVSRIHGTTRHTGRLSPAKPESSLVFMEMEVKRLRKELAQAIQEEDYEKAAKIRDEMRRYEKRTG